MKKYFSTFTPIEPLALFRILFGIMMLISTFRFIMLGWIDYQYIDASFHFKYFGFEWIEPMGRVEMYILYSLIGLSTIGIIFGFFYRLSIIFFFLAFTYCELIDKTYYLNHYYFISLVSFLLIFLPASGNYSLDVHWRKKIKYDKVPSWCVDLIKFQLGLVYFYAGLAKLNQNWLFDAMPLKIWLPSQSHLPIIGSWFQIYWIPYVFSWAGALYDICIPFILLSRFWFLGYIAVIVFHLLTGVFFQIGMFPIIMIFATPIFFPTSFHQAVFTFFKSKINFAQSQKYLTFQYPKFWLKPIVVSLFVYVLFQISFPWRFILYPGNMFWTEEGYRFGWRVMLMEKSGSAIFYVKDGEKGKEGIVNNADFLNSHQEKQMAMQPDMILEFAHYLGRYYSQQGMKNPIVRTETYVSLNGKRSQLLIQPEINLLTLNENMQSKDWLLPFHP